MPGLRPLLLAADRFKTKPAYLPSFAKPKSALLALLTHQHAVVFNVASSLLWTAVFLAPFCPVDCCIFWFEACEIAPQHLSRFQVPFTKHHCLLFRLSMQLHTECLQPLWQKALCRLPCVCISICCRSTHSQHIMACTIGQSVLLLFQIYLALEQGEKALSQSYCAIHAHGNLTVKHNCYTM